MPVAQAVGAVVVLNRCSDWRLVTATSGHTAPAAAQGDPVPGPNQARLMRMLPSGYSPGSCEPATTPPRALAKIVCTHNGDPAGPTATTYTLCRRKSVATAAFRRSPAAQLSSRARESFSRPDPGAATPRPSKSAARWCAAIAMASRRSPGPPGPTCSSATSMPIELGRRSTSSTNGVGALLTSCDQGRHDGCPHRLGGRQEGGVTLKLGLRGFVCRPAAVARCGVITMTNRRITVRCATRSRFIEAMAGGPVALRLPQRRGVAGERG